jgi:hypothetical protein
MCLSGDQFLYWRLIQCRCTVLELHKPYSFIYLFCTCTFYVLFAFILPNVFYYHSCTVFGTTQIDFQPEKNCHDKFVFHIPSPASRCWNFILKSTTIVCFKFKSNSNSAPFSIYGSQQCYRSVLKKRSNKLRKETKLRGFSPQAKYTWLSDRRLSAKLVPTFADRGCHMVSATDPHGR